MQKITNCIKYFSLSLIITLYTVPTFTKEKVSPEFDTAQAQIKQEVVNEYLEERLKPTLKLFEQLDFICEHLAQVINNHQLRNIDKKQALTHIKSLRNTILEIKKGSCLIADPYSIKTLLDIAECLIEHARIVVYNGLKEIPELQLENVIKRSMNDDTISFEQLEQKIAQNELLIQKLDNEAQNIGLSLFNRTYRRIEKFSSDHHLLRRGAQGLLLGLGVYCLFSRLDNSTMEKLPGFNNADQNSFVNKLKNFKENYISQSPRYNLMTGELAEGQDLKGGALIESYLGKSRLGIVDLTIPPLITWSVLAKPFENNWKEFKVWTVKKWETMRSYLRGGPVEKKVEYWKKEPRIRFQDIIGKNHHKNVLGRIVDYIRDHERYDRAGISPEAGYLLAGPSRTGKTYMAEALAGEVKDVLAEKGITEQFNFFSFHAADVAEWGIETIMMLAKENAPCVLFIDEIDMCGWQRERDAKSLSQVLTAMSGCMNKDRSKTVILIGATNKPQNLDQALLQKGRFGKVLWYDYPTLEDRLSYLVRELENRSIMSIDPTYIKKLAQETDRCSFDELNSIIVTALQKSKADGQVVSTQHLEQAFDEEVRHVMHDDVALPEEQKKTIAAHQAGHALAFIHLNGIENFTKVTIRPITKKIQEENVYAKYHYDGTSKEDFKEQDKQHIEYGKLFTSIPNHADTIKNRGELLNLMRIELAGHSAEEIILGSTGYTYHRNDNPYALQIAKFIVYEGMYEKDIPKETRQELNNKAYALLKACKQEVRTLLEKHKEQLIAITQQLENKLTLSQAEIIELLNIKQEEATTPTA